MYNHVPQEQLAAGEITENIVEFPVVPEQVIVQAIPHVVGSLPPVEEFARPVYNHVHHVKRTSPDTENHEQNGYAKLLENNNILKTNVDNCDMTYTDKHNMRED